jgi:hypothetical protein
VYVSPMPVNYSCHYEQEDASYWFYPSSVTLQPGGTTQVNFGGRMKAGIRAVSDFTTLDGTDVWLFATDSFGNLLRFYRVNKGQEPKIDLSLVDEAGLAVFAGPWVHSNDLHFRVSQPRGVAEKLTYRLNWNLGRFGQFNLKGKLLSTDTQYPWTNVNSQNFEGYFPRGAGVKGAQVIRRLESAYTLMSDYIGSPKSKKLKVYTPVHPPSAGYAGGREIGIWNDGFRWWNRDDQVNVWEACLFHELGHHVIEYAARQAAPFTGMRNEVFASLLAHEALNDFTSRQGIVPRHLAHTMWTQAAQIENQMLPRHACGNLAKGSSDFDAYMIRFLIETYLPKQYGRDVNRRFFRNWVACKKLLGAYTEEEAFVVTYSFLCQRNLAGLFRYIGYEITSERVAEGLRLLTDSEYSEQR